MRFYINLALKNVFRERKRSFTLGINYAVVTFILVLLFAFSQGATQNITTNLVRSSAGHITVSGEYSVNGRVYQGVRRYPDIEAAARKLYGSRPTIFRYVVSSALYYKGAFQATHIHGYRRRGGHRDPGAAHVSLWRRAGFSAADNGVVIPKDVANYFGLAVDDEVVIATRTRFGAFNTGTLKIQGIYETGNFSSSRASCYAISISSSYSIWRIRIRRPPFSSTSAIRAA